MFGQEDFGLSANDLLLCSRSCSLATSSHCSSVNLSHAISIVLSRFFETSLENSFLTLSKNVDHCQSKQDIEIQSETLKKGNNHFSSSKDGASDFEVRFFVN